MLPPLPFLSSFCETNVRAYVLGPDGRDGIFFFALEAESVPTVLGARLLGVPYNKATMSLERDNDGQTVHYRSTRRFPGPAAQHDIVVRPGSPLQDRGGLADWLCGRWRAWTRLANRWAAVSVSHEPWPLQEAAVERVEESLLAAVGFRGCALDPPDLVHYAAGVDTKLGFPRPALARRARSRRSHSPHVRQIPGVGSGR
jgi:uncharacterized protein YqjF (DUF2071 family)